MVIWDTTVLEYVEVNFALVGTSLLGLHLWSSVVLLCVPTLSPLGSSSALLFWYGIPQAASHEECLAYQSNFCHKAFFCQVALQQLQYLFHAWIGVLSTVKPLGAIFFSPLEVYTGNSKIFPVMLNGSCLSYLFVKRTRCFVCSCSALVISLWSPPLCCYDSRQEASHTKVLILTCCTGEPFGVRQVGQAGMALLALRCSFCSLPCSCTSKYCNALLPCSLIWGIWSCILIMKYWRGMEFDHGRLLCDSLCTITDGVCSRIGMEWRSSTKRASFLHGDGNFLHRTALLCGIAL